MDDNDDYQLSEYELQRLERIRKNEAYLQSLGLQQAKNKLMEATTRKTKRNQNRVNRAIVRRSNRLLKKDDDDDLVMLPYYDDNDDAAVKQTEYKNSPIVSPISSNQQQDDDDSGSITPSPSFRRARRSAAMQLDFCLTKQEKAILEQNTMDDNYLTKFREFLVYHNKISEQNVRNVMRQVTKLATGQGVHYDSAKYGWKPHQVFQKGVKISPLADFVQLLDLAAEAEAKWGRDHGNGWLLSHPLKKMLLFQQFCLQNPDFLSTKGRLSDYYAEDEDVVVEETVSMENHVVVEETVSKENHAVVEETVSMENHDAVVEPKTKKTKLDSPAGSTPTKRRRSVQPAAAGKRKRNNDNVGRRIAKQFADGKVYYGKVTKYSAARGVWWIDYDDGDSEELDEEELQAAMDLNNNVGDRIAKEFDDGKVYLGTVTKYSADRGVWWIDYDDGDSEELVQKDLKAALDLFARRG